MFCERCGNQLGDDAIFCANCGNIINASNMVNVSPTVPSINQMQVENTKKEGKKGVGAKILLIIGIVIVFLAVVIGGILLIPKLFEGKAVETNAEITSSEYGNKRYWDEYEEDRDGNQTVGIKYDEDDEIEEWYEWDYDRKGNLIKEIRYIDKKVIDYWLEFDEDGNTIKEVEYSYLKNGSISGWEESDEDGRLIKEVKYIYDEEESLQKLEEYDGNGNTIKEVVYEDEKNISAWTEWEYDEDGRIIKILSLTPDGNVGGQIEYTYDRDGRKIREVVKNGNKYIDTWIEWEYDSSGNVLKEERYDNDAVLIEWNEYQYDGNNNCLEKICYNMDGTVKEWYSWEYDREGHCIEEIVHHTDGTSDMGYGYDEEDNQIDVIDYDTEKLHFEVLVKSYQSTYWHAAVKGINQACAELGVTANCNGPANESDIADQVQMLDAAIEAAPDGICLAACDTKSVLDSLAVAAEKGIPVVCFDTVVENAPKGSVIATVATDNVAAGACAATNMFPVIEAKIEAATVSTPVRIGEVNQDATALNIQQRGLGFINEMIKLCNEAGKKVAVEGNEFYVNAAEGAVTKGAEVIIEVGVPAQTTVELAATEAKKIMSKEDTIAIFGSNQTTAEGILTANETLNVLGTDPEYCMIAAGFDAGYLQKAAIEDGLFIGSVTQSPLMMGYFSIYTLYDYVRGEAVSDITVDGYWYNTENMEADDIAPNLYD